MTILWLDTETYSEVPIKHGTYKYTENCDCLLVTYAFDDGPVEVWDSSENPFLPVVLSEALKNPTVQIRCHIVPFDRGVLRHALNIDLPIERFYDTSIQARACALPGGLASLCEVLGLGEDQAKIKDGKRLIQLFCVPKNFSHKLKRKDFKSSLEYRAAIAQAKENWPGRATAGSHPEEWARFVEYAKQDIVAMRAASKVMPTWNYNPKSPDMALWYLDQKINDRGIFVDQELANAAIRAVGKEKERLAGELQEATGFDGEGAGLFSATEGAKFKYYVLENFGVALPNLKKATLALCLEDDDIPEPVKELIANRLEASGIATTKYQAVLSAVSPDGRVRGTLQYDGAGRTRRWAGRVIQPQNMFKSKLKAKELEAGMELLKLDAADMFYDNVMQLAASAIRGVIISPPGKKLVVSDLSNIEGRDTAWLTGEKWKLQAFRDFDAGTGPDLYKLAYAKSFRVPVESIRDGSQERQIGKTQELALQYGGGVGAFVTFATANKIDLDALADQAYDDLPEAALKEALGFYDWTVKKKRPLYGLKKETFVMCEVFKRLWREANPNITASWKEIENAVKSAIYTPGETFPVRSMRVRRDGKWLRIALPSGRSLCYPHPQVDDGGQISYMGQNQYTRKWQRLKSFGGKFLENGSQSFARDLMADNLPAMEDAGYHVVLTAHDEAVAETLDSQEFTHIGLSNILATNPSYAKDLPLAAKGFESYRYRKD